MSAQTLTAPDGEMFVLYPAHVAGLSEDDRMEAPIFETCRTLAEARRNAPAYGPCAIYRGEIKDGVMGDETLVAVVNR